MSDLYDKIILAHHRAPQNRGRLDSPTHEAVGYNPVCGDEVQVSVQVADNRIEDIQVDGTGCALCRASGSLMTVHVRRATAADVSVTLQSLEDLLAARPADTDRLGDLAVFQVVREHPMRLKCVTLPWHALETALLQPAGSMRAEYNAWTARSRLSTGRRG